RRDRPSGRRPGEAFSERGGPRTRRWLPGDPDRRARERVLPAAEPGALDGRSDLRRDRAGHARLCPAPSAARVGGGAHARDSGVSGRRPPGASRLSTRLAVAWVARVLRRGATLRHGIAALVERPPQDAYDRPRAVRRSPVIGEGGGPGVRRVRAMARVGSPGRRLWAHERGPGAPWLASSPWSLVRDTDRHPAGRSTQRVAGGVGRARATGARAHVGRLAGGSRAAGRRPPRPRRPPL